MLSVLSVALNVPGPLAAALLAAEGARVVKVEPPGGDPLEALCAPYYRELHAAVRVERIDLKSDAGRTRMQALLDDAALFLASQRPAALVRLGLDADTLLAAGAPTAHLRWLNIVGELARPDVAGHDLTYVARAGLLGVEPPPTVVADVLGAHRAFAAALLLLRQPPGARATVGLYDSLAPLVAPRRHGLTGPGSPLGGQRPGYGIYATARGRVALAALEPHFLRRLLDRLGVAEADLATVMRARTAEEWEQWAEREDIPLARVRE